MLTEKDYCDYDTCVALKELGFPTKMIFIGEQATIEIPINSGLIQLYEAQKWLIEKKNIQIEIPISFMDNGVWKFSFRIQTPEFYDRAIGEWDSYEEALLDGIKEAIKILKEEK